MVSPVLVNASYAAEMELPATQPLTLTRNFGYVVGFCLAALVIAPLVIAWTASVFLT